MNLIQIAAMAKNRVIGVANDLPWTIKEDMDFFRKTTSGKVMIMGRKTFESFGSPLKNRFHIVITRNPSYQSDHENVSVVNTLDEAVQLAREIAPDWHEDVFIVGGGEIYRQALPITQKIYLTEIDREFEGDTFFPEVSADQWKLTESSERTEPVPFRFNTYTRI